MLSSRSANHFEPGASINRPMPLKTPARVTNTPSFKTIERANLKENTTNRVALLKTAPRSNMLTTTPGPQKQVPAKALLTVLDANINGSDAENINKRPHPLNLTNRTPFVSYVASKSPTLGNSPIMAPFQLSPSYSRSLVPPETLLRPSRARTSLRVPRISEGSTHAPPKTPDASSRKQYWENNITGDASLEVTSETAAAAVVEEMDGEIEYMPPKVSELPYDPGFDMPDYKVLGSALWTIGNIVDFTVFAGSRPHEKPLHIEIENSSIWDDIKLSNYDAPIEDELTVYVTSRHRTESFTGLISQSPADSAAKPNVTTDRIPALLPRAKPPRIISSTRPAIINPASAMMNRKPSVSIASRTTTVSASRATKTVPPPTRHKLSAAASAAPRARSTSRKPQVPTHTPSHLVRTASRPPIVNRTATAVILMPQRHPRIDDAVAELMEEHQDILVNLEVDIELKSTS